MNATIQKAIQESINVKQNILADQSLLDKVEAAGELLIKSLKANGKVLFCGNGGSAADAQHIAAELSGRFYKDRPPLYAEALHVNSSYLTAVANDYGYDKVFSRMVEAAGKAGDILVAISTSGNSTSILEAARQAKSMEMPVISLTGATGGQLAGLSTILLNMPSTDTPRIQEAHILIGHILCEKVEAAMF